MNASKILIGTVMTAALAMAAAAVEAQPTAAPTFKAEKCYGVVKAGKNDCQTAASSCAGTSKTNAQKDAWIYVPAGACEKIVGASLKAS
ncbi:MAG: DUF2282 domain-containing protein [Alphaproteobacteria bacterium]|nr:DUF2282 domain-containing protein [Alphaproteobacteria bacterium]